MAEGLHGSARLSMNRLTFDQKEAVAEYVAHSHKPKGTGISIKLDKRMRSIEEALNGWRQLSRH